jgi:6-phosphogluconolactonase
MARRFVVLPTRSDVEVRVADQLLTEIMLAVSSRRRADVVVTGGTVGIGILAAVLRNHRSHDVDWSRVHVWWGDERFVPDGHADRNDQQARVALLDHIAIPAENLHSFPNDVGQSIETARDEFLAGYPAGFPQFDVALNGIGPDGHAASLFPGRDHGESVSVIAVRDSPKLPSERLSFTFGVLNQSRHVWIVASGADKADAIGRIAENSPTSTTPAAGLSGVVDTVVWLDTAAAALLPD